MLLHDTAIYEISKRVTALLKPMAILKLCRPGIVSLAVVLGVASGCAVFQPQGGKPAQSGSETSTPDDNASRIPPIPPAKPPLRASTTELDPQRLVGLNESGVADLIGTPQDTRDESPARVWHYTGDKCSLDVLFYFDLSKQQFRALTYSVEPAGKSDLAQRICLGGIQEAQRGTKR